MALHWMRIMSVWIQIAIRCWGLTATSDDGDNRVQHPAVARERAPSKILLKLGNSMLRVGGGGSQPSMSG